MSKPKVYRSATVLRRSLLLRSQKPCRSLCVALLSTATLAVAMPARADDYVVDNASTTQNAGVTLADGDTFTVTETGTIATGGFDSSAVFFFQTDNVTTINNGTLTTTGSDAAGIEARESDNFDVSNAGMITTTGSSSEGIYFIDGAYTLPTDGYNLVANSGTISTEGSSGTGIYVTGSDRVRIENSGTINTAGAGALGMYTGLSTNALVFNSGNINTEGDNAFGFHNLSSPGTVFENTGGITTSGSSAYGVYNRNSPDAILTNDGTISTSGDNAYGIYNSNSDGATINQTGVLRTTGENAIGAIIVNSDDAAFTNSGVLHTTGVGAYALVGSGSTGAEYTNSGYLVSEQGFSIALFDANAVLNLRDPAYLGGAMLLASGTEVDITTGPSHAVYWNFGTTPVAASDLNVSGDVPWFFDSATNTFATYDPTAPAALLDATADAADMLSRLGRNKVGTTGVWATAYGGRFNHNGDATTLDRNIAQHGFALGYANASHENFDWNVMIGTLKSDIKANSVFVQSDSIKSDGWLLGATGRYDLGKLDFEAGVVLGGFGHDSSRFVNDNLAQTGGLTLGEGRAVAKYDSKFIAPEVGLSYLLSNTGGWNITPAGRLRYVANWVDGYSETGSGAATVGGTFLDLWELDLEVTAARHYGDWGVSSTLGYTARKA